MFLDEEPWWYQWGTKLTDTEILVAIIGFIGTAIGAVITTYPCCKLIVYTCQCIGSAQTRIAQI